MEKKQFIIRDKKIKKILQKGGRLGAKQDFSELLRRAISSKELQSG
jgi:hypothetical protein